MLRHAPKTIMSKLDLVQTFIAHARMVSTPDALRTLLADVTREMGYDYFALLHHVDLSRYHKMLTHMDSGELVALSTYPETWIDIYLEQNIVSRDPILLASHRTNVGFFWDEVPSLITVTQAHREVQEATVRAGIVGGFTVPAHVPGEANGSCNFAMGTGHDVPAGTREMAQLVGSFAFNAARVMVENAYNRHRVAPEALSPRQIDCLVLAARGKRSWEIGRILGISEGTVRRHMEMARLHYDVTTREQVIMRALFEGQFALADVVK